jgi:hypothetical protein
MDYRWPRAAILILIAATGPAFPVRESAWTVANKRIEALRTRPAECLTPPQGSGATAQVMIGRAAFNTPNLLGGQAARAGLSCASCHVNGRGNPNFVFPGLSEAPGTADVTASIMSTMRGDGILNPKPIPDLAIGTPKIARAAGSPALRDFIRGLIVEEFDGHEPTAATLDGLAAYVRALSPTACPATPTTPVTLNGELSATIDATEVALRLWKADDEPSSRFLIAAARAALGRIDERYAGQSLVRERKHIEGLDAGLLIIQHKIDAQSQHVDVAIAQWQKKFAKLSTEFAKAQPRSLYAIENLQRISTD